MNKKPTDYLTFEDIKNMVFEQEKKEEKEKEEPIEWDAKMVMPAPPPAI